MAQSSRNSWLTSILHDSDSVDNTGRDFGNITVIINDNLPMQYTANFHNCKIGNFQMKYFDVFLAFA